MPANLPPQFFEIQGKLKTAKTKEEKIEIYEKLLAICPKHKGTEKVQEDLKRKIAKLKKEEEKRIKGKSLFFIKKEGAGQIIILGPANSGKTTLVNNLTGKNFEVADYPFTTKFPQPAMMKFENIQIQLVDTPPLSKDFAPGWMKNLCLTADGILILANFDKEIEEIKKILENWKIENEKIILTLKKEDLKKIEINSLKKKIFDSLRIVRIYLKPPQKKPDFENPLILKSKSKILDLIEEIKPGSLSNFKMAKLFKKDSKFPKIVGKDYTLEDEDIVEIKV